MENLLTGLFQVICLVKKFLHDIIIAYSSNCFVFATLTVKAGRCVR